MALIKFAADLSERSLADALGNALRDFIEPPPAAVSVFESGRDGWRIEAYFDGDAGADERDLAAELSQVLAVPLAPFTCESVPDLNWVAISQAALPPVRAGRFTVHGSHDRGRIARGPNTIVIDAGEAFGTAHHATTFGSLLAIDRLARQHSPDSILDLGCGSGVLAIAAAKALPAARIVAADIDRQAISVATANARLNGVAGRIALFPSAGVAAANLRRLPPFDLLIANILAGPLMRLAPEIARSVKTVGTLVLSGILIPEAAAVVAAYGAHGFNLERHDRIAGWSTLTLRRR
jgi:ribosomal protein L11 methyltransferase